MTDSNKNLPANFAALFQSQHVSAATREALERKMEAPKKSGYFNEAQLQTLAAVAAPAPSAGFKWAHCRPAPQTG